MLLSRSSPHFWKVKMVSLMSLRWSMNESEVKSGAQSSGMRSIVALTLFSAVSESTAEQLTSCGMKVQG